MAGCGLRHRPGRSLPALLPPLGVALHSGSRRGIGISAPGRETGAPLPVPGRHTRSGVGRRLARFSPARLFPVVLLCLALPLPAAPLLPPEQERNPSRVFRAGEIGRPLRYHPDGAAFVITNGTEFFNRPLYANHTSFRVDAGDRPEFSLYLPGRGGNLRFAWRSAGQLRWLHEAAEIVARYEPGRMRYRVRDPLLDGRTLELLVAPQAADRAFIVRVHLLGDGRPVEFFFAFGGLNGMRGRRGGDIGCEREPVAQFFQLRPEQCRSNEFRLAANSFLARGWPAAIRLAGQVSPGATLAVADARFWNEPVQLLNSTNPAPELPVLLGRQELPPQGVFILAMNQTTNDTPPAWVGESELHRLAVAAIARTTAQAAAISVATPDPFLNAAVAALNVAADGIWDDAQQSYMHGAVAWRTRLLGWRGLYAGTTLGHPGRTAAHLAGFFAEQNTNPIPDQVPPADEDTNLARSRAALHSHGNLTKNHYDMNLVAVDGFFRYLLWTGDVEFARRHWPVLERHFAWERRLFRRPFGPDGLPLYEGYAAIWASDDLQYSGGGTAHASAYNYWHNLMAARVAPLVGADPAPYAAEAHLIRHAMKRELWLPALGWLAECKDWLGRQSVQANPATWSFYHPLDSAVPDARAAWQMTRYIETRLPRFPLRGPGVPPDTFNLATTSWHPYTYSLNNVVIAESTHTALGCWQAGRPELAFPLFKGALLDGMFLGLCPGNLGMTTWFDAFRRESQRDFADGVGATARAMVEGLFGVEPDLLAGELMLRPGWPDDWSNVQFRHPQIEFRFQREDRQDRYVVKPAFPQPVALRLVLRARADNLDTVLVNGKPAGLNVLPDSIGVPRIEIRAPAAAEFDVRVAWHGESPAPAPPDFATAAGQELAVAVGAEILALADPQNALASPGISGQRLTGQVRPASVPGGGSGPVPRTVFAHVRQGAMEWWQPVHFTVPDAAPVWPVATDWNQPRPPRAKLEPVALTHHFNDRVTRIFHNEYRSPRSPFVSLALPKQGIGAWCHPFDTFEVDDSGLRAVAATNGGRFPLPNGVPLATPAEPDARNVAFVSQWDNYPEAVTVPLAGRASRAWLLLAGSSNPMQSRRDNGEIIAAYTDGTTARLPLINPTTWWPIDQDYYLDDFAFARPEPLPLRVDLATGRARVLEHETFQGRGGKVPGGAATALELPLDPARELQSLTVRALANEVVIGLLAVTLER